MDVNAWSLTRVQERLASYHPWQWIRFAVYGSGFHAGMTNFWH